MRSPLDFVHEVERTIAQREICILYEEAFSPATADKDRIWPEMRDPAFRQAVLARLPEGEFLPPDELDEWVFTMYPPEECYGT